MAKASPPRKPTTCAAKSLRSSTRRASSRIDAFDFKGNLRRSHRQLAVEYRRAIDWSTSVTLQSLSYMSSTAYDALNRPAQPFPRTKTAAARD